MKGKLLIQELPDIEEDIMVFEDGRITIMDIYEKEENVQILNIK